MSYTNKTFLFFVIYFSINFIDFANIHIVGVGQLQQLLMNGFD